MCASATPVISYALPRQPVDCCAVRILLYSSTATAHQQQHGTASTIEYNSSTPWKAFRNRAARLVSRNIDDSRSKRVQSYAWDTYGRAQLVWLVPYPA